MWETSAYWVEESMEVDEMALAENEEIGSRVGNGHIHLHRIIIIFSMCAWFICKHILEVVFLITPP